MVAVLFDLYAVIGAIHGHTMDSAGALEVDEIFHEEMLREEEEKEEKAKRLELITPPGLRPKKSGTHSFVDSFPREFTYEEKMQTPTRGRSSLPKLTTSTETPLASGRTSAIHTPTSVSRTRRGRTSRSRRKDDDEGGEGRVPSPDEMRSKNVTFMKVYGPGQRDTSGGVRGLRKVSTSGGRSAQAATPSRKKPKPKSESRYEEEGALMDGRSKSDQSTSEDDRIHKR